jgi:hypothetical protein
LVGRCAGAAKRAELKRGDIVLDEAGAGVGITVQIAA